MLHKIKHLLVLALIMPMLGMAQFTFSGKIMDAQTKQPMPGAHIKLSGLMVVSSQDGNFKFTNLKANHYHLEISYLGYKTYEQKIEIAETTTKDVFMEYSTTLQDEVVIVAYRANEKTGTSFTNLTKAEIKKADAGMDIPYLLDMTPSLVTNSDAGTGIGYTSLRIRGSDLTRINVTINGIPYNDPESQGAWFVDLPDLAASLNSIQVQRGVGTSVNGSAAFGATIDLQTQALETKPYGELSVGYGSFNTQRYRVATSTGLIDDKYSFDLRLSSITSDGFIDRASSDLKSFFFSGAKYGKNSILRFNIFSGKQNTYQAWTGVPKDLLSTNRTFNPYSYENEVDDYLQTHYQLHFSKKINNKWLINSALHYTKGSGFYENFKEDKKLSDYNLNPIIIGNDTIKRTDLIQQKWLDNDFYGGIFNANYDSKKLKLIVGGAINQYLGNHFGEIIWSEYGPVEKNYEWYRSKGTKTDMNIFTKATWIFNSKLNVYGDIQYRKVIYQMNGIHDDLHDLTNSYNFDFINPKVGLVYRQSENHEIYSSFSMANKEPSRNNYRDADMGYTPQPEQLSDFELGYGYTEQKGIARINFYYMKYKNQLVETGKVNNVGSPIMTNVKDSYRTGIEIVTGLQLTKNIHWNFNISLSENKIFNFVEYVDNWDDWSQKSTYLGKTDISFSPNIVLKNGIEYSPIKNGLIIMQSRYVGRQYIDNTSNLNRSINPYFVSDLILNYKPIVKKYDNLSLQFRINNIFNEEYETGGWVYRYLENGIEYAMDGYFPQAGINFSGGITLRF